QKFLVLYLQQTTNPHVLCFPANDELKAFFGKCKNGKVRAFKVEIQNEQLALGEVKETCENWEYEYEHSVLRMVEEAQPCYLFFRLDTKSDSGYHWLMISWSPDNSPVRQKMLYASTKATIKKEFGASHIKHELFGTLKVLWCVRQTDINLKAFQKHLKSPSPAPLTEAETELLHIKKSEVAMAGDYVANKQSLQAVAFPLSQEALSALTDFRNKRASYIQLSIDIPDEMINLERASHLDVHQLFAMMPSDHARYHLFRFPHSHEGDFQESIDLVQPVGYAVFIYSMPSGNCPIKERMLYSSCKGPLTEMIQSHTRLTIHKKLEVDSPEELTEKAILEELHPKRNLHQPQFSKPKGPANRGARRIIKSQNPS
ncbi:TWF1, partial [Cordylochernes scorpioides]